MEINGIEIEQIKFGSSPHDIDDLANKVLTGDKTATSSLLDYYLLGLKKRCEIGDYFTILNSLEKEVAIIKIEHIKIIKYGDISESFAIEEGDGNYTNWQTIHEAYYTRQLSAIGKELTPETLLVCEWFKVVRIL